MTKTLRTKIGGIGCLDLVCCVSLLLYLPSLFVACKTVKQLSEFSDNNRTNAVVCFDAHTVA